MTETLNNITRRAIAMLRQAGIEDPAQEARILIGGLLGLERRDFITKGDRPISEREIEQVENATSRRISGEPPFRILGQRPFHGLELRLSRETLEPRPDTEILVDLVLHHLHNRLEAPLKILDLGTGTGAICLALLQNMPAAHGMGVDLSLDALTTARRNAQDNGLADRFSTIASDWFSEIDGNYDVIVSNPPYIPTDTIPELAPEVRNHDPMLALDGGPDGLVPYRIIAAEAGAHLAEDGLVAVETGHDQQAAVQAIFTDCGFEMLESRQDYAGNDRAQIFRHDRRRF